MALTAGPSRSHGTVRADLTMRPAVLLPVLSLSVLLLVAVLPWGLSHDWRFVLPMLPYAAIHYWTLNERGAMPSVLVFVAGVVIDLVTDGPLGFWSMVYLTGHMCAHWLSGPLAGNAVLRWIGFLVVLCLLAAVQWVATSIYFVRWQPWEPFLIASATTALFYPLLSFLMVRKPSEMRPG